MDISEQQLNQITKAKTKKLNSMMRGVNRIQDDNEESIFKQNKINNNTFQFDASSLAQWHGEGKVEIPVEEFLRLLSTQSSHSLSLSVVSPPQSFFISKASYVGHAKENYINLQCSFEVAILVDTWTRVKLMPDGVGLASHSLSVSLNGNIENISNSNNNNNNHNANPHRARLGVMEDGFWLVTEKRGEYLITLNVRVPYHSPRKSGLAIWVPRASENSVTFTVKMKDIQIKVDPSFVGDDSEENKNGEKKDESSVSVLFPPTNVLNINWTVKIDEGPSNITKDAPNKKMMITAEHNSMCSIGEGVVLLTTVFSYSIVHGSVSTFEILVPDDLHVLGVEGNGLKKWEVIGGKDKTALIELDDGKNSQRCLRVVLDYGLENSYTMTVLSEVSMAGTSADVTIPSFKCIGEEINREKGYLAIEARTNVEIAEIHREFLALVDTSELPQTLWKIAGNPILMGYKFLSAGYELGLRVKKHDDVGVLVAACDDAHFITTVSQEGRVLHKLILRIRNTQKQYVRVKIPVPHEIWSASVAGVPIKPALDETGQVMVQLQKMSGKSSQDNPNNVFVVELVYIENQLRPLDKTGDFSISLAQLDIPINYLFVSFYLPSEFQYTEFVGGLKEVTYFSRNPPTEVTASDSDKRQIFMPQSQSNYRARSNSITMDSTPKRSPKATMSNFGQNKGVLPVKVQMPVSGREFKFEQLIVMAASLTVTTTYTKTVSYSHNRKNRRCLCF